MLKFPLIVSSQLHDAKMLLLFQMCQHIFQKCCEASVLNSKLNAVKKPTIPSRSHWERNGLKDPQDSALPLWYHHVFISLTKYARIFLF